jgi:hypothetical protein
MVVKKIDKLAPVVEKEAPSLDTVGSAESWEEARAVAALIKEVPNSFSTCIRFLRADFEQKQPDLSKGSKFYLLRLLKSQSVSAPLYFAALTYRPEIFQSHGSSIEGILKTFKPEEIASLLSLVYLYRAIRKGCDPEEWKFIDEAVQLHTDLCGLIGDAIPSLGLANAVLVGGLRPLAQALFLGIDKPNFIKYRRAIKKAEVFSDMAEEMRLWRCTFGQVASILAQPIGLGIHVSEFLSRGFLPEGQSGEPREAIGMRVTDQWLAALIKTGKEPQIAHRVEFFPHAKDVSILLERIAQIRQGGSVHQWLAKGKDSVSPETTPGLFLGSAKAAPEAALSETAPPDAVEVSEEELKKLEE